MPTVREIMTSNVQTVRPACTVREAIEILLAKRISGLPVVDDAGRLVGILTEFALLAIAYDQRVTDDTGAQHMTTAVLTVDVDDAVSRAADLFIVHRVRRVPVVERGRVVGLVSRCDVLKSLYAPQASLASV